MISRNPIDVQREKTEDQRKIHHEREERNARLEEQHEVEFLEEVREREGQPNEDQNA